jgi:nicotinamide phosphoribosyltransferase
MMTVHNTHQDFAWLPNFLETILSTLIWKGTTSASTSRKFYQLVQKYVTKTNPNQEFLIPFMAHDFSMRGMDSLYAAGVSGLGHLLYFQGSDTLPAIWAANEFYRNSNQPIMYSVNATEHSVMSAGTGLYGEEQTFRQLIKDFPSGILSVVSDTFDLWKVLTEYLPAMKKEIMARDGKLVIRPDSGDPVDILCGFEIHNYDQYKKKEQFPLYESNYFTYKGKTYKVDHLEIEEYHKDYGVEQATLWEAGMDNFYCEIELPEAESKGVIELLWDTFGGTVNEQGYKCLDSHIGAIYGDSITLDRAVQICERLKAKGFASTNVVLGIGSYTYQYNTRDTLGFAVKATYCEVLEGASGYDGEDPREFEVKKINIFKDPLTDDGTKKSAKGLLAVHEVDGKLELVQECNWDVVNGENNKLRVIYTNSTFREYDTFDTIRKRALANEAP